MSKDIKFIRWGSLNPQKQKENFRRGTYHSAPARKGIYAFPEGFVERFLLGGCNFNPERHEWVKDKDGNLIRCKEVEKDDECLMAYYKGVNHKTWEDYDEIVLKLQRENPNKDERELRDEYWDEHYLARYKPAKKFNHYGEIWTHLDPVKNSNILGAYGSWYKVDYESYRKMLQKWVAYEKAFVEKNVITHSQDHMEVFIERIQKHKK